MESIVVKFSYQNNLHRLAKNPHSIDQAKKMVESLYPELSAQNYQLLTQEGLPAVFPLTKNTKLVPEFGAMDLQYSVISEKSSKKSTLLLAQDFQKLQVETKASDLKLKVLAVQNQKTVKQNQQYVWPVQVQNSGTTSWPSNARLYQIGSLNSWPLAELGSGESIVKKIKLTALGTKTLLQFRAGLPVGTKVEHFGPKICHQQIPMKGPSETIISESGISCAESTWRQQKRR